MVLRLIKGLLSAILMGGLTYGGCYYWPLKLAHTTALVAGISVALAAGLVAVVYLDSREQTIE